MAKMPQRPWQQFIADELMTRVLVTDHFCFSASPFSYSGMFPTHSMFKHYRKEHLFWSKLLWKPLFKVFCFQGSMCLDSSLWENWNGFLLWFSFYLQEAQQDSFHQESDNTAFRTAYRGAKTSQWCWRNPSSCLLNISCYITHHR